MCACLATGSKTHSPTHQKLCLKDQFHLPLLLPSSFLHRGVPSCYVHQHFCLSWVFSATQGPFVFAHLVAQHNEVYRDITTNLPQPGISQMPQLPQRCCWMHAMPEPARVLPAEITCILKHHCSEPLEQEGLSAHSHWDPEGASSMKSVCSPSAFTCMQSDPWGDSSEEGAALYLGNETQENNLPFCFPCGHREITQPEPEHV